MVFTIFTILTPRRAQPTICDENQTNLTVCRTSEIQTSYLKPTFFSLQAIKFHLAQQEAPGSPQTAKPAVSRLLTSE